MLSRNMQKSVWNEYYLSIFHVQYTYMIGPRAQSRGALGPCKYLFYWKYKQVNSNNWGSENSYEKCAYNIYFVITIV